MISLSDGAWTLTLLPDHGGCVQSLSWKGVQLLRPGPSRVSGKDWDARDMAAFPMVPFVGRIQHGHFSIGGRDIVLRPNMPPEPHAIHGFGWQAAWSVSDVSDRHVTLQHTYGRGSWPWPYRAGQTFTLEEDMLNIRLDVTNLGQSAMPAGLGWHPYFSRSGARIRVQTRSVWETDMSTGAMHPRSVAGIFDLADGAHVDELELDHAFSVAPGAIEVSLPECDLTLETGPNASAAIVYVPKGEDFFCVEPATHVPDAVNISVPGDVETGLQLLAPGETLELQLRLRPALKVAAS